jgi:hypothetical protein
MRITRHYEVWRERKGLKWRDYLKEISENDSAGMWVREAAIYLHEKDKGGAKASKEPSA